MKKNISTDSINELNELTYIGGKLVKGIQTEIQNPKKNLAKRTGKEIATSEDHKERKKHGDMLGWKYKKKQTNLTISFEEIHEKVFAKKENL